jgi:hypothetical protein
LENKKDIRHLNNLASTHGYGGIARELVMPGNGITSDQIGEILEWCVRYASHTNIVFFDWDRTLTVVEGTHMLSDSVPQDQINAYTRFIFGGEKRFGELSTLFRILHRIGVEVFVLTNNSAACDDPAAFVETVKRLDPRIKHGHVYCSRNTMPTTEQSNKAVVLPQKKQSWHARSTHSLTEQQIKRVVEQQKAKKR